MSTISGYSSSYGGYSTGQVRQRPSEEEMAARKKEIFKKIDTDGNGSLSKSEFSDFLSKGPNGSSLDANSTFSSFDTDGDGSISESEMDKGMRELRGKMRSTMSKMRFAERQNVGSNDIMSSFDSNGDGNITEDELKSGLSSTKVQQMISAYIRQLGASYGSGSDSVLSALTA